MDIDLSDALIALAISLLALTALTQGTDELSRDITSAP